MTLKELELALIKAQRAGVSPDEEIVVDDNADDNLYYAIVGVWESPDNRNTMKFGLTVAQLLEE